MEAFLQGRIGFLDIARTVAAVLDHLGVLPVDTLEEVFGVDQAGRRAANDIIAARGGQAVRPAA